MSFDKNDIFVFYTLVSYHSNTAFYHLVKVKYFITIWYTLVMQGVLVNKFSERLKELRTDKGLSIQALAKEVGIGSSSLCRWENQQADIKGSQLVILAKYFKVTIDCLMGLED